jgi:hypothetical protein
VIRSPDRPARSQLLYLLSYPALNNLLYQYILSGNVFRPLWGHLQGVELQKYYTSQKV